MKPLLKVFAIAALVACAGLVVPVFANCQSPDGSYPVSQCGGPGWFASPPVGSGTPSAAWWQLGFGNATRTRSVSNDPANGVAKDGTGFVSGGVCTSLVCTAGLIGNACTVAGNCNGFIGNDNGLRSMDPNVSLSGLSTGAATGIAGMPADALCFDGANSWGASQVDGCADNARSGLTSGDVKCDSSGTGPACGPGPPYYETPCAGVKNDDSLNKYWGACKGLGVPTLEYQLDAPMGALLKESNNKFFALAFFANTSRAGDAADPGQGSFRLDSLGSGATNRGDANPLVPGRFDIIPWQSIPQPVVTSALSVPSDPHSTRIVGMTWPAVRIVDDGSVRPSTDDTLGTGRTGVGVRDQGPLVRHLAEISSFTVVGGNVTCGTFSLLAGGETTGTSLAGLLVPEDRCLRLRTAFGSKPASTVQSLANASVGNNGDVGYEVVSRNIILGGNLVSEKATLTVATKNKNAVSFEFTSASELNTTGFEIVGRDTSGKESVIGKVNCKECDSGRGASYSVVVPNADVKGAKTAYVRTQPSGEVSNTLEIK